MVRVATLTESQWLKEAQVAGAYAADAAGCLRAALCRGPHLRWRVESGLERTTVVSMTHSVTGHLWVVDREGAVFIRTRLELDRPDLATSGDRPVVVHSCYEQERWNLFAGSWAPLADRSRWTQDNGQPVLPPTRHSLPSGRWVWECEWYPERTYRTDEEGWQYSKNGRNWQSSTDGADNSRRRRWMRRRCLVAPNDYWFKLSLPRNARAASVAINDEGAWILSSDWELFFRGGIDNTDVEGSYWAEIATPKVRIDYLSKGQVMLDGADRLVCVSTDGSLVMWRPSESIDTQALALAAAMNDDPDTPQSLPGAWETLSGMQDMIHISFSNNIVWGVMASGQLLLRRSRNLSVRESWQTVLAPSSEMAELLLPGTDLGAASCPAMTVDEYLALGSARITAMRVLRQARADAVERRLAESGASASAGGGDSGANSTEVSSAPSPRTGLSPIPSDTASASDSECAGGRVLLGGPRQLRSDSVTSETSAVLSTVAEEAEPVDLLWVATNLLARTRRVVVNDENCYALCVDDKGQLWGRLGLTPSQPQGRYWIRLLTPWTASTTAFCVEKMLPLTTFSMPSLKPGTWAAIVVQQLKAHRQNALNLLSDKFQPLVVVPDRDEITAQAYVNRFGVQTLRNVHLHSSAGTLKICGESSAASTAASGNLAHSRGSGRHRSMEPATSKLARLDAEADTSSSRMGDTLQAAMIRASTTAVPSTHLEETVIPLTEVHSIVIARSTRSQAVESHTIRISTAVQFFESIRISYSSALECNEWLVLLRRAVAAARRRALVCASTSYTSTESLKDLASSVVDSTGGRESEEAATRRGSGTSVASSLALARAAAIAAATVRTQKAAATAATVATTATATASPSALSALTTANGEPTQPTSVAAAPAHARWSMPAAVDSMFNAATAADAVIAARLERSSEAAPPVPSLWAVDVHNQVLCCDFFLAHLMNDSGGCAEHLVQPLEAAESASASASASATPPTTLLWAHAPPLERTDSWGRVRPAIACLAASPSGLLWVVDADGKAHVLVTADGHAWVNRGHAAGHRALQADLRKTRWQEVPAHLFVYAGGFKEQLTRVALAMHAAWVVTSAGTLLVRHNISVNCPTGTLWERVECDDRIVGVSVLDGAVLALTATGSAYTRVGFSDAHPSGTHWLDSNSALVSGTLGASRPDPQYELESPHALQLGSVRRPRPVSTISNKSGNDAQISPDGVKPGRKARKAASAAAKRDSQNGLEGGNDGLADTQPVRRKHGAICHNHNMALLLRPDEEDDTTFLLAATRNGDGRLGTAVELPSNGDLVDVVVDSPGNVWAISLNGELWQQYRPWQRASALATAEDVKGKRVSRRQRRREARLSTSDNAARGWRRWSSFLEVLPERPLLLSHVSTGGLHPRWAELPTAATVLADDTLCMQPSTSEGGKAVAALLEARLVREASISDRLLHLRFLNPPLIVRTVVMARTPQGAWLPGRIAGQRRGIPSKDGDYGSPTMFVMVHLDAGDDIWVDTRHAVAERRVSSSWLREGDLVLAPGDATCLPQMPGGVGNSGTVHTLAGVRSIGFSKGRCTVTLVSLPDELPTRALTATVDELRIAPVHRARQLAPSIYAPPTA